MAISRVRTRLSLSGGAAVVPLGMVVVVSVVVMMMTMFWVGIVSLFALLVAPVVMLLATLAELVALHGQFQKCLVDLLIGGLQIFHQKASKVFVLFSAKQSVGVALGAGAASSADAMYVCVDITSNVVVYHSPYVRDVQSASRDIRCNK